MLQGGTISLGSGIDGVLGELLGFTVMPYAVDTHNG